MTPIPVPTADPSTTKWYWTLLGILANAALGAILNHYLPGATVPTMTAIGAAQALAPSPLRKK